MIFVLMYAMGRFFVFIISCFSLIVMQSCLNVAPSYFKGMNDETDFIQSKDIVNSKCGSLAIIKPNVFVGKMDMEVINIKQNLIDPSSNSKEVERMSQEENKFMDYCCWKYDKLFKKKIKTYSITLSDTDYTTLKTYIYGLKKTFHSQHITEMKLTPEINKVIDKCSGNYFFVYRYSRVL
jgi:hypothetical protein